VVSCDGSGQ